MALNVTTDYAIRILLFLSANAPLGVSVTGKIIAEDMRIPYNYFLKIVPHLKRAGFIESFQGKNGGFALVRQPEDITLYDVIAAMDDDLVVSECLHNPAACGRNASSHCAVHNVFSDIQTNLDKHLKSVTLDQLQHNQQLIDDLKPVDG
ncbi:MAG: Rrf2 family transcriptional regulator [Clostridiales bacterium]|uniref:Rrf2 family protein n=1 Tax=Peptococcus niger TaxID=2741 RepID=A0A1G6UIK6_PEPNI|nr:Rrf2 family transcriptional regulator [Peptococcus niger]MDU5951615.1 Rrf2 family transcriptional regulator [Clostridiales bacterium]SDD41260.1 Rrf2 family protein [Peptococcus niger]